MNTKISDLLSSSNVYFFHGIKYLKCSSELRQLLHLLVLTNKRWHTFMVVKLRPTLRIQGEVCLKIKQASYTELDSKLDQKLLTRMSLLSRCNQ